MPNFRPAPGDSIKGIPAPIVRPMLEQDLDRILAIESSSFSSPWRRTHFLAELNAGQRSINRVVCDADRILAYACLWKIEDELRINNFAVDPSFRRRGLGRWFLGFLLDEARDLRCRVAMLEVRESNRAARRLYREAGFVEVGRRKGYYRQAEEDAVLMDRALGR